MSSMNAQDIIKFNPLSEITAPINNDIHMYNKESYLLMIQYPNGNEFPIHTASSKTIYVSKDGNTRFSTIKEAVDHATSNGNGFEINVQPGVYVENNPLELGTGNTIHSDAGPFITTIVAQNPNENLINIGGDCFVRAVRLVGCTGGAAISHDQSLGNAAVTESIITGCQKGIEAYGYPGVMMLFDTQVMCDDTYGVDYGIHVYNGGNIYGSTVVLSGYPTNMMTHAIYCDGSFSSGPYYRASLIYLAAATANYATTGIYADNNARVKYNASSSRQNTTAIHIGSTGTSEILLRGVDLIDNTTDLLVDATEIKFVGNGVEIDPAKIINNGNAELNIVSYSNATEEEGMYVYGKFNVGEPAHASRSQLGSGDNYTRTMKVFWNTNGETGTWTDQTTAATFATNPSFTLFSDTSAGNCTYFGSDFPFGGIGTLIETVSNSSDDDNRIWEIWNGAASPPVWEEFNIMVTEFTPPYYSHSRSFAATTGILTNRFGIKTSDMETYGKKTLNGEEKYWVRVRATDTQLSNPTIQKVKIHSNHKRINVDGYTEYFGDSRPVGRFPWETNIAKPANSSPSNMDVYLSDNLSLGRTENYFSKNNTDRLGFNSNMPYDLDTSFPIKLQWEIIGTDSNQGDVHWVIRWGRSSNGIKVYQNSASAPSVATGEKSQVVIQTIPGSSSDTHLSNSAYINIDDMNFRNSDQNDLIWITVERIGSENTDTYSGEIGMIQMAAYYVKWCDGGHLTLY